MISLMSLSKAINKNTGTRYILYEFILIFFFALAYWLSDLFLNYYPDLGKKLGLGSIKQLDSFYSYLYFSLITQTTVGFGGILPGGGDVVATNSRLLRGLNLCQMVSIIIITGWALLD
jgi:hypothetical protein